MLKILLKRSWKLLSQKTIEVVSGWVKSRPAEVNSQITDAVTQQKPVAEKPVNLDRLDKQGLINRARELGLKVNNRMRKDQIRSLIEKAGE